jgi:hypothetical protein
VPSIVTPNLQPDIPVRVPTDDLAIVTDIVRGAARQRPCPIVDRTESVGRYLRPDIIEGPVKPISGRNVQVSVALREGCPVDGDSGQKRGKGGEFKFGGHDTYSFSG